MAVKEIQDYIAIKYIQWNLRIHCKGHIGDNINSAVLSFIERLSSLRGRESNFWDLKQCPL